MLKPPLLLQVCVCVPSFLFWNLCSFYWSQYSGCFWGVQLAFQRVPGVASSMVGYTAGSKIAPTYKDVCNGTTGKMNWLINTLIKLENLWNVFINTLIITSIYQVTLRQFRCCSILLLSVTRNFWQFCLTGWIQQLLTGRKHILWQVPSRKHLTWNM